MNEITQEELTSSINMMNIMLFFCAIWFFFSNGFIGVIIVLILASQFDLIVKMYDEK